MWLALNKIAVCFMTALAVVREAAKRLLGAEFDGVLVTDQYAGYRFIDADQRQLCWARGPQSRGHRRVASSATAHRCPLVLLADAVFRTRHRWESGALNKQKYLRRLARYRQSWRSQLGAQRPVVQQTLPWTMPVAAAG